MNIRNIIEEELEKMLNEQPPVPPEKKKPQPPQGGGGDGESIGAGIMDWSPTKWGGEAEGLTTGESWQMFFNRPDAAVDPVILAHDENTKTAYEKLLEVDKGQVWPYQ